MSLCDTTLLDNANLGNGLYSVTQQSEDNLDSAAMRVPTQQHNATIMVRDDAPMEYDGILETDFIWRHKVIANYDTRRVSIDQAQFKMQPYIRIKLKPLTKIKSE
ncbi:hypothetical protein ALC57_14162 [Trachymyrmex cornetzi]|uniref:Uncharacterized protein n=1 Tax=Trachymyrmex cornetzi TaxID=471704 RepID=A0A151IYM1_9HYME|nr:hypothetical protein ALC57_14162 [Trachymyrmex cornetzi]